MTKKRFPLERILTVSATEYVSTRQAEPNMLKYDMVGVHASTTGKEPIAKYFATVVPSNAEVVVGYRFSVSDGTRIASGTALIPRGK
jgi:hypothetical protein